jgi:translation initiation factor 4E
MGPPGCGWKDTLKHCGDFEDVNRFWSIFNNLKPASQVSSNSNYSLFRYGIQPGWEDPANINGGKFVLTIPKKESREGKGDKYWLFSVLAVIGETMDETGDEVNGVVVSIRKQQDRVALWLKSANRDTCIKIGTRWKKVLNLENTGLRFQTHQDAMASGNTYRNQAQFQV